MPYSLTGSIGSLVGIDVPNPENLFTGYGSARFYFSTTQFRWPGCLRSLGIPCTWLAPFTPSLLSLRPGR